MGNRSALHLWAVLSGVIGAAMIVWAVSVQNGAVRFLGGFLAIAASIVFELLGDELAELAGVDGSDAASREDARATER